MLEDVGARLDVEPDGWLIEDQQPRAMQQRPGDLDAAHLSAGQIAHLVVGAVGEGDLRQHLARARACSRLPMP